jgi:hypothetical protein
LLPKETLQPLKSIGPGKTLFQLNANKNFDPYYIKNSDLFVIRSYDSKNLPSEQEDPVIVFSFYSRYSS